MLAQFALRLTVVLGGGVGDVTAGAPGGVRVGADVLSMTDVAAELTNLGDASIRAATMEHAAHSNVEGDSRAIERQESRCGASHESSVEEEWAVSF